ncbi:Protein of unknown function DUF1295 [Lasiodiplodia theobromae]|nr:Protein of unknown function DUF1295 [Lasiodiplodia theobromae]
MPDGSEQRALGEEVVRKFYAQRAEMQHGKPHVLLNRLYTHPDYRSRGCASALVRNGCEMADCLFLPVWVESSPMAEQLYRKHGFDLVCRPDHVRNSKYDMSGPVLRREARGPVVV